MKPKTILATWTVLLISLVGSAAPVAQRTPELTPDQLHAWRLAFDHPFTGEHLNLVAEPPADLLALLAALRPEH
jgi:hypothetical protein